GRDQAGNPCYAMRFVQGTTLAQAIEEYHARRDFARERAPMETDRAFRGLLQRLKSVCTTVAYAHSRKVLHRDLKPANIMLGPFDETLVLDWGLARMIGTDDAEPDCRQEPEALLPEPGFERIQTRGAVGTPGFMS